MLSLLEQCRLCPRNCNINRIRGERGFCQAGDTVRLGRAALHHWEEPCLSGERGSGAVFFSYCTLRCVYCQNTQISHHQGGIEVSIPRLAEIFRDLEKQGAHNLNLVTPTHYVPQIITALQLAREQGLTLPVVYNTSGYEKPETIELLKGYVDIYLPDFKYFLSESAGRYSSAPNYPEVAKAALDAMVEQVGAPIFGSDGMMKKGVIVRHLVLPEHEEESRAILSYLVKRYGDRIWISLMSQYTPFAAVERYPELNRRVSRAVYDALIDYAVDLGLENCFIQEEGAAEESFIPAFNGEGCL